MKVCPNLCICGFTSNAVKFYQVLDTMILRWLEKSTPPLQTSDTLPLALLVKPAQDPPTELQPKSYTCPQQTVNSKVSSHRHLPKDSLTLGNVVQSYSTAWAPEGCRYSFEHHWASNAQDAEGDVNPSSGVCHPTDPT